MGQADTKGPLSEANPSPSQLSRSAAYHSATLKSGQRLRPPFSSFLPRMGGIADPHVNPSKPL